jgi:hypothetical protein
MKNEIESATIVPDPAAVFASALSLWQICQKHAASDAKLNLSECYNGMDQFMRELMRVANQFETWACMHVDFNETSDVWPYLLEDKFGEACLAVLSPDSLAQFDDSDCLRVAMQLRLPIKLDDRLPIPIDVRSPNPTPASAFREFRILTMRNLIEDGDAVPFTADDEPFDDEFGHPYFGLYGVDKDGLLEHVADRKTYSEAARLAEKLAPGVEFPDSPTFVSRLAS